MSEDWCAEKLASLKLEENVKDTLKEICTSLKETKLENRIASKLMRSNEIFKFMDDGSDE